jgi:hypothetical protein
MAREINASADRARCSTSLANRRLRRIQERVRSTTQRIGRTAKPFCPGSRRDRYMLQLVLAGEGGLACTADRPARPGEIIGLALESGRLRFFPNQS